MLVEERIARIGLYNPGSHLGIPYSHVSAKELFLYKKLAALFSNETFVTVLGFIPASSDTPITFKYTEILSMHANSE
jgi:hypothetical protein